MHRAAASQQALGYKERMLCVIACHSTTEQKTMAPATAEELAGAAARDTLGGQPKRIANRRSQEYAPQSIAPRC
jgi:hypothetical protein